MGPPNEVDYGTQFLAPLSEWKMQGATVTSVDSVRIQANRYAYSGGSTGKRYSELLGKTVIIDFDVDIPNNLYKAIIGVKQTLGTGEGISAVVDRKSLTSYFDGTHLHAELVIGTDFITSNTTYFITLCLQTTSSASGNTNVSNIKCGYK